MADNFTQVKNELIRSTKLTIYEKAVLFVILSYGSCEKIYLSQATIAKESCMSRNMVHRAVNSLRKGRYISTVEQVDRATLEYKLLCKVVTPVRGKVTPDVGRGYTCQVEGVTPVVVTSNKRLSNKNRVIKDTAAENLITEIINLWNEVSGQSLRDTTTQYRKEVKWCLGELKGLSDAEVLEKFKYAFENKKRMYDDPAHILSQFSLSMVCRQSKFMGNVDAPPHKGKPVVQLTKEQRQQQKADAKARSAVN